MENIKIGYFSSLVIEDQFIGGIMITDHRSIPLEFKYTEPIKPTKIHKIIFGKVLEKYINEEVIKKNLIGEIKSHISLYFVSDLKFLASSFVGTAPIVAIQNTNLSALAAAGDIQRVKEKEVLIQPATSTNPLKLTFTTPESDHQDKIINTIVSLIKKTDLIEPFTRVETALKSLCQTQN